MNRRWLISACCSLCFAVGAANAKPNFSGEWKANLDKSDLGPMPPPKSIVAKIKHADPDMTVSTTQATEQGDRSYEAAYNTDGKETSNKLGPMDAKSTAGWEGDTLVVKTKLDANGTEIAMTEKWTLAENGKTLKRAGHINSPQGEFDIVYVFERQ